MKQKTTKTEIINSWLARPQQATGMLVVTLAGRESAKRRGGQADLVGKPRHRNAAQSGNI